MNSSRATGKLRIVPAWLLTCLLLPCAGAQSAAQTEQTEQTEQRLTQVRQELDAIARERRRLEAERGVAAQQLRQADEQVAAVARALSQTEAQLAAQQASVDTLAARRAQMHTHLDALRAELARLVRSAYIEGNIAPLKQLLAQEEVQGIQRTLVYQRYLHRQRAQRIAAVQDDIAALDALEHDLGERQRLLQTTRSEQQQHTRRLERERRSHANTRAALDSRHANQRAREQALGQDIRALEQLLTRLRTAATSPNTSSAPPLQPGTLAWPLAGALLHRFGQRLTDGRLSTGLLIDAALGAPVHAVGDGAVVFSDWMTGYGMLLILDHGHGQMSLYAHNETLLKQTGERVQRGEVIASVGHSGGQNASALYFELRQEGEPINPERWLSAR